MGREAEGSEENEGGDGAIIREWESVVRLRRCRKRKDNCKGLMGGPQMEGR